MPVYPGPQPLFTNPTIKPERFKPSVFELSGITQGILTRITTSTTHNFVVGHLTRLHVSSPFGMTQIDEKKAIIVALPSTTQADLDIDSTNFDGFIASPTASVSKPQIAAIATDGNYGSQNNSGRTNLDTSISGSFKNIS